jgi:aryl-alcohol dehydrogenase-like predicted oxidoreductase
MKNKLMSHLVLGTAQLGFPYGIANKTGQPIQKDATEIVRVAFASGMRELDTAQDYGRSEKVLGHALAKLSLESRARVITKIDPLLDHCNPTVMARAIGRSFSNLKVRDLFGVMLHNENLLAQWSQGIEKIFCRFIAEGRIKNLGVSVYTLKAAERAVDVKTINMIQLPANILDRRFEKSGVLLRAKKKKKEIYIRSAFLQGLLLMDPMALPGYVRSAKPILEKAQTICRDFGITRHQLALGYLKARYPFAKVVIGVETKEQLLSNIAAWKKDLAAPALAVILRNFDKVDENILNPSLWKSDQ